MDIEVIGNIAVAALVICVLLFAAVIGIIYRFWTFVDILIEYVSPKIKTQSFLTLEQVCKRYRVNRLTVLQWISDKKLPAIKIRMLYRIRESDLDEFEKSNTPTGFESNDDS